MTERAVNGRTDDAETSDRNSEGGASSSAPGRHGEVRCRGQAAAAQQSGGGEDAADAEQMSKVSRVQQASITRRGNAEVWKLRLSIPVSVRDERLAAERLAFACRHPTRHGTVELGIETAAALLAKVAVPLVEEIPDDGDDDTGAA